MSELLEKYQKDNTKQSTFILLNGFHLHGELLSSDEEYYEILTIDYGPARHILQRKQAVSTIVPGLLK